MVFAKQVDVRSNMKKYFDMAYEGETIFIPRSHNKNVVIMSEAEYNSLRGASRIEAYSRAVSSVIPKEHSAEMTDNIRSDNEKKLDLIQHLKDGWNGNGSPAVPQTVISRVRELIGLLPVQPEIFPTALKSIQMEFDNSRHDHMEMEMDGSDKVSVFTVSYYGEEREETIPTDNVSIIKKVMDFYG